VVVKIAFLQSVENQDERIYQSSNPPKSGYMSVISTGDGSPTVFSEQYGVTYHSRHGAVTESAHVFISAGLRYKAVLRRELSVLEAGLGTGLNAFMTWLEAERRNLRISYTGLELYPLPENELAHLQYAGQLGVPDRQADFFQLHQLDWEQTFELSDNFRFEKKRSGIEHFQAVEQFDIIYFDAFAPQAQPELWTPEVMAAMYAALRPEGVLVTYCAQGEFKRSLRAAGFSVERLQGPPGKREMTRATK